MQSETPVQLTQVPPKPTCNPNNIFTGNDCQDRINLYNQAVQQRQREELQLYVGHQKELASSQAVAPLQKQIADLTAQIGKLHEQMQADATAELQAKNAAHMQGMEQGAGIGVAVSLILFGVVFAIRKITSKKPITQARAASA
jgi:hypothetical protein